MTEYTQRINVRPLAKHNKEYGFIPGYPINIQTDMMPNTPEAYAQYTRLKPELYVIGEMLAKHVVTEAYKNRDVDKMFKSLDRGMPFMSLGASIRDEVHTTISKEAAKFESGQGDMQLLSAYRRLKELVRLEHTLVPEIRGNPRVDLFLQGGVNTGADVMSNILHVTAVKVNDFNDPNRLIQVAKNSYPFIVKLASGHAEAVLPLIEAFRVGDGLLPLFPFSSRYFDLTHDDRERLVLSEEGKKQMKDSIGVEDLEEFTSQTSPTVGCLAMINAGGGSAVSILWEWHLEMAKIIFPKLKAGKA